MKIHPLRREYNHYIRITYGERIGGPGNIKAVAERAQLIKAAGIDYSVYVDVACSILHDTAKYYDWPYPYWNVVIAEATIEKVIRTLELIDGLVADGASEAQFLSAVEYTLNYVRWFAGMLPSKPDQEIVRALPVEARIDAAEYVCLMYGVQFNSTNLNHIAQSIQDNLNGRRGI